MTLSISRWHKVTLTDSLRTLTTDPRIRRRKGKLRIKNALQQHMFIYLAFFKRSLILTYVFFGKYMCKKRLFFPPFFVDCQFSFGTSFSGMFITIFFSFCFVLRFLWNEFSELIFWPFSFVQKLNIQDNIPINILLSSLKISETKWGEFYFLKL